MPPFQQMPSDLLSAVALFLGRPIYYSNKKDIFGDLLSLRCTSKAGEEAVRLAANKHEVCDSIRFENKASGRGIAAITRVFGHGCRTRLAYSGRHNGPFHGDVLAPLLDLVLKTRGRLVELVVASSAVSVAQLLDMCRASPKLKLLSASGPNLRQITSV